MAGKDTLAIHSFCLNLTILFFFFFFSKYIGFVQFYFKHTHSGRTRFLVFILLPKAQRPCSYDNTRTMVQPYDDSDIDKRFMVIEDNKIVGQVGLVVAPELDGWYKMISAYILE